MPAKKTAPFIFFFLLATFLLLPTAVRPAHADTTVSFTYDGEEHPVDAALYADAASFAWYRDGEEQTVSESRYLSLAHVADSGTYRLYSIDDGPAPVAVIDVVVTPRVLRASWHTLRAPTAPIYQRPYVYDKTQQGVFPYPENAISGDDVSFSSTGNTAIDAGDHTARILSVDGRSASDYTLAEQDKTFVFTIGKATVYATPEDTEIAYGETLGDIPVAFVGLLSGDENAVTGSVVTDYIAGDGVGAYSLSYTGTADNYVVFAHRATLTVSPRPVSLRLYDAEGFYGDEPTLRYDAEGTAFTPVFTARLSDTHVGEHTLYLDCNDENFRLDYAPATYRVLARPVTLAVTADETLYGSAPTYRYSLQKGTLAPGDTFDVLQLSFSHVPEAVGTYAVYPTADTTDYCVTLAAFTVTIRPFPVALSVRDVIARYGEAYVSPVVTADRVLPYAQTVDDLDVEVSKDAGWTCGVYALNVVCHNANYKAVSAREATYTILPREFFVALDLPAEPVIKRGEPLVPNLRSDTPVGTDAVTPIVAYYKLNANGIAEKEPVYALTEKGDYIPYVSLPASEDAHNYLPIFLDTGSPMGKPVRIYSDTHVESNVSVTLVKGFTSAVSLTVKNLDVQQFADRYESDFSFQSVVAAFHFDIEGANAQKMYVSVPINHEKRHYTAAIIKEDGSVVYAPCVVEHGVATFETAALGRTFLLWEDNDGTSYAWLCVFLAIVLVLQLAVLGVLYKKYKTRDPGGYFALLPAVGAFFGDGIYFFAAGALLLGIGNAIAFIAVCVFAFRLTRKKRAKVIQ